MNWQHLISAIGLVLFGAFVGVLATVRTWIYLMGKPEFAGRILKQAAKLCPQHWPPSIDGELQCPCCGWTGQVGRATQAVEETILGRAE